jgi:coenzyme F420-reducing hydrogenase delta subunit
MNNDNDNENNDILDINQEVKKVKNRRIKRTAFAEEKKNVSSKILELIGIGENKNTFYSHIIDENKEIQDEVYKLDDEIKRIFQVSAWSAYKPGNEKLERRYLSIIKSVLKATGVQYTSASLKMNYNGNTINTTLYTIQ